MLGRSAWRGVCACRDCGNRGAHRWRKRSAKRREALLWRSQP